MGDYRRGLGNHHDHGLGEREREREREIYWNFPYRGVWGVKSIAHELSLAQNTPMGLRKLNNVGTRSIIPTNSPPHELGLNTLPHSRGLRDLNAVGSIPVAGGAYLRLVAITSAAERPRPERAAKSDCP